MPVVSRRAMIAGAISAMALAACGSGNAQAKPYPVHFTAAEWRKRLSPGQFWVLREKGTERPGSSPLLNEHRKGTFLCAGCALPLFASTTKFESGTGWPSFWAPLKGAIGTSTDWDTGDPRTEVHCARCGGHLGHVFDDGPKPTGRRYCMNGLALQFRAG
jgi:peptide-methionine (R)-S-oxide reductase